MVERGRGEFPNEPTRAVCPGTPSGPADPRTEAAPQKWPWSSGGSGFQSKGQVSGLPEQPQHPLLDSFWPRGCSQVFVHLVAGQRAKHHCLSCSGPPWALPISYLNRRALQPRGHYGDLSGTASQVDTHWPSLMGA